MKEDATLNISYDNLLLLPWTVGISGPYTWKNLINPMYITIYTGLEM